MKHIEECLEKVIEETAGGNAGFCILLESKGAKDRWVQLTWDTINAAYPFDEEPLATIKKLKLPKYGRIMEVSDWQPKSFATFEHVIGCQQCA